MKDSTIQPSTVRRLAITVRGVVQGVGFRPFVFNTAHGEGLTGWVRNEVDTVRIEVQGGADRIDAFLDTLRKGHPPRARIDSLEVCETACGPDPDETFQIRVSSGSSAPRPTIPADLATCEECLAEIGDPHQRRYGYPFTNCTNCGPRWSIVERLPYDRPHTSMASFAMCPDCRAEYEDPTDRRFHAQPIACPRCGPSLSLVDSNARETAAGDDALRAAVDALLAGRIVAVKGLGGFQLLADATSAGAVAELRRRKQRPDRPFALMLSSLDEVRRRCDVSPQEGRALCSHEAPILLLRRRVAAGDCAADFPDDIAPAVAPGNPYLGVMLPYTPLHHLLTAAVARPIVCTSGNLAEEPMATTTGDALIRLGSIADLILTHDRRIVRPVDDSVARVGPDGLQLLRRARGFAPLPVELALPSPTILAVGGHLKNAVALALGTNGVRQTQPPQAVVGAHVGDLESVLSVEVHRRAIQDLTSFFEADVDLVACDLHPDYASTREAETLAAWWEVPLIRVQHHHAHVAACMAEHKLEGPVLGFAWDGTGYGTDGAVWGGEALACDGADFTRVAHLRTFARPGGDRAAREPRRSALGVLFEIFGDRTRQIIAERADAPENRWFEPSQIDTLLTVLDRGVQCPRTSSMGRLFDAVAALCGLSAVSSFEGQAAMALEFAADATERAAYPLPLKVVVRSANQRIVRGANNDYTPAVADWEPLIRGVLEDLQSGESVGRIAARFHNALAEMAVSVARRHGCRRVALTGGCFQNALLTERVRTELLKSGFDVYTHRQVPPGDGGIALGQLHVAAAQNRGPSHVSRCTG